MLCKSSSQMADVSQQHNLLLAECYRGSSPRSASTPGPAAPDSPANSASGRFSASPSTAVLLSPSAVAAANCFAPSYHYSPYHPSHHHHHQADGGAMGNLFLLLLFFFSPAFRSSFAIRDFRMLSKGKGKSKDGEKREGQSFSVIATQRERVEVGPGRRSLSSSRRAASVGDPFAKGLTGPSWLVHSLSLLSSSLPLYLLCLFFPKSTFLQQ